MDFEAVRAGLEQAIPFNVHVGLEVGEVAPGRGVVTLPDRDETRNHVGSQHAGALFSAGEAASGAAFVGSFAERMPELAPLAEGAEIAYKKIARGTITATGTLAEDPAALLERLDADGRVRFPIAVEMTDADGTVVADMTVQWYVKAKSGA